MKELLQIKKIIALLLTIVFCYLSAIKYVSTTEFLSVFTMVIGFYYGQSSIRQTLQENIVKDPGVHKIINPTNITNDIK